MRDKSQLTRIYQAKVMKNGVDPRFHICTQYEETIDHLISRWPAIVPNEYLIRHDRVAQNIYWKISKHSGAYNAENW